MALASGAGAFGQNVFLAAYSNEPAKMVKGVSLDRLLVETDGKTEVITANHYSFGHALFYRPGLVTLSDFRIQNRHLVSQKTGANLNYELRIFGNVTSDVELKDCFLVLEIDAWKNLACVWEELRDLGPGKSTELNHTFMLDGPLVEGNYRLHIFSAGLEVLHSRMRSDYIAVQQEKTKALLAHKNQDFPPLPAHRSPPTYPAELKSQKSAGSAQVKCVVTAKGEVKSVTLVSATQPAFGEAALAAVPKWKFDPAVKDRHFVDGETVVTVEFKAPK
jgi:TonB family protein